MAILKVSRNGLSVFVVAGVMLSVCIGLPPNAAADIITIWPTDWSCGAADAWEDENNILGDNNSFAKGIQGYTGTLNIDGWDDWTLPGGQTISNVQYSAKMKWEGTGTTGSMKMRLEGSYLVNYLPAVTDSWAWYDWDITSLEGDGWTKAEVDALPTLIRRANKTDPAQNLRLERMKIVITYIPEPAALVMVSLGALALLWRRRIL